MAALLPDRPAPPAAPPSRKETLAVVSTTSKLCGVAAYTAALQRQLGDAFDITVFDLNQYLLRNPHRRVRKLADRHIKEICREIRRFDIVNLQLEHGTLGRHAGDIYRRFCWLCDAAASLSVTFHTLPLPVGLDMPGVAKALLTLRLRAAIRLHAAHRRRQLLACGIARRLRRAQLVKRVSAIVHNRRDAQNARYLYGLRRVFDHPLSFLSADEIAAIRAGASRRRFPMLDRLPDGAVLIGVFGFLNEYKGIATAIQALHHLPETHHLLIFGGIHPQEIALRQARHPYIASLFRNAYIDRTLYDELGDAESPGAPQLVISDTGSLDRLLGAHPRDMAARIHFMGAPAEADFLCGMAVCDAVVFPYLEVGQSASGPISQALELGCRIIASRTATFLEFAEYHQDAIEFFDIGNHLELAERLLARPQYEPTRGLPPFNVATNKATYLRAHSRAGMSLFTRREPLVTMRRGAPAER